MVLLLNLNSISFDPKPVLLATTPERLPQKKDKIWKKNRKIEIFYNTIICIRGEQSVASGGLKNGACGSPRRQKSCIPLIYIFKS